MIDVTEATRIAYMTDGTHKSIIIKFPNIGLTLYNDSIVQGSFSLEESLLEGSSLEFIGCIASKMEVTIANTYTRIVKDSYVEVDIVCDNTDTITIFKGFVDSSKKETNKKLKHIVAYDPFYKISDIDVTNWYNSLGNTSVENVLISLFTYCRTAKSGLSALELSETISTRLINKNVIADGGSTKKATNLNALDLLKSICQINGVFGLFDFQDENLTFDVIDNIRTNSGVTCPGSDTYPSDLLYPSTSSSADTDDYYFEFYEKCEYEDYAVQTITAVVIRNGGEENDVKYGSGDNKYIIRNNVFMITADDNTKSIVAKNILDIVGNVSFVPFSSQNNGLPFLQCGDEVSYRDITSLDDDKKVHFIIFSRTLSGDQFLRDSYKASGDEYQKEFITEISVNLSDIEDRLSSAESSITDLQDQIDSKIGWDVKSVLVLPANPDDNTIYLIQGIVEVN